MSPALYHAHHQGYLEDVPYWLSLAKKATGGVLELGCGTGRVLLPLLEAGIEAVGLDSNKEMLGFLAVQLKEQQLTDVELVNADITDFQLERYFGLIILPCNTYSTLSPRARQLALTCIRRHLIIGGRFVASMYNPYQLAELEGFSGPQLETDFIHPLSGNPVQVSGAWMKQGGMLEVTWHYDHLLPDGRVERSSHSTYHQIQDWHAYQGEIEAAGLVLERVYGDFVRGEFGPHSNYAVFTCVRKD